MKNKKKYSEENESYTLFKPKVANPISIRKNREYIDELNREKEKSCNIRELKKKDVREFIEETLNCNLNPSTSIFFPNGKSDNEIISNLKKIKTEDNFFILADKNDRFSGFCGIEYYENIYGRKLFFIHGPIVKNQFQRNGYGNKLLNKTLEFASIKGFETGVLAINSKNVVAEHLLLKNEFKNFKTQFILEEKRATRVRIFKNLNDKIFIIDSKENIDELYELYSDNFLNNLISSEGFKEIISTEKRIFFICKRSDKMAGYMEVDMSNIRTPIITSFKINENNGDNDSFRLLLFSIVQFVFKNRKTLSLKLMIENNSPYMEEVNKLDFRFMEQMDWYFKTI